MFFSAIVKYAFIAFTSLKLI